MRIRLRVLLLIALFALLLTFVLQNANTVSIRFIKQFELPMWLLTVLTYVAGMLSGWALVSFVTRSLRDVAEHRERPR
jgi:uncharacterized integral membrane protein